MRKSTLNLKEDDAWQVLRDGEHRGHMAAGHARDRDKDSERGKRLTKERANPSFSMWRTFT